MTTPLVLLHPLGSDRDFWLPIIPFLDHEQIIALDLPGHGQGSELVAGADIDALAWLVLRELDDQGIGDADVVGISLGGLVAQRIAARCVRRVRRLVLVDTVAVYPPGMRQMWSERSAVVRASGTAAVVDATLGVWFTSEFVAAGDDTVRRTIATLERMPAEAYARTAELLEAVNLSNDSAAISAPTLVVYGAEESPAFVAGAQYLAEHITAAHLESIEGKHAAVLEHPAAFAALVNEFCGVHAAAAHPVEQ